MQGKGKRGLRQFVAGTVSVLKLRLALAARTRGRALQVLCLLVLFPAVVRPSELVRRAESRLRRSLEAGRPVCEVGDPGLPLTSLRVALAAPEALGSPTAAQTAAGFLEMLARSELHDHLGGGFFEPRCRDGAFQPTFEKRLTNNARLLAVFSRGYGATGRLLLREAADQTIAFLIRDLRGGGGLFFSGLTASPETGAQHFLWTEPEVRRFLGDERAREFFDTYELRDGWLSLRGDPFAGSAASRLVLLVRRGRRVKLAIDTRPDPLGNALAIAGLSRAGEVLGRGAATEAARRAARQARSEGLDARAPASMAWARLELSRSTRDPEWLAAGRDLVDDVVRRQCRILPDGRGERLACHVNGGAESDPDVNATLLAALRGLSDEDAGRYRRLATRLEAALRAASPPGGIAEEMLQAVLWETAR